MRMGDVVTEIAATHIDRAVRGARLRIALEQPRFLAPIAQIAGLPGIDHVILERAIQTVVGIARGIGNATSELFPRLDDHDVRIGRADDLYRGRRPGVAAADDRDSRHVETPALQAATRRGSRFDQS